jgi:5-amino-6-(5-phosphoribosylamino)uracil reductase
VTGRPYVVLSCAMSVDGYIDNTGPDRLVLSSAEDLERVDALRASCDAILVGAGTVRRDDPRLLVRSAARREERVARGATPDPIKATVTASGDLDPSRRVFSTGDSLKLVYCASPAAPGLSERLGKAATVVEAGDPPDLAGALEDLAERGVRRLLVEGGGAIHTQLLTSGLADELQLAVAPIFVGDPEAPRFVGPGTFPWNPDHRMTLERVQQVGDIAVLRYLLTR